MRRLFLRVGVIAVLVAGCHFSDRSNADDDGGKADGDGSSPDAAAPMEHDADAASLVCDTIHVSSTDAVLHSVADKLVASFHAMGATGANAFVHGDTASISGLHIPLTSSDPGAEALALVTGFTGSPFDS